MKGLIKSSLRLDDPVLFLMDKTLTGIRGEVGGPEDLIPLGRADVVRAGQDVTLVSYAASVRVCHQAADMLHERGISAEVIDLRTLYPLDLETVCASVRKTGRAVIVDKSADTGGSAPNSRLRSSGRHSTTWMHPSVASTPPTPPFRKALRSSRR